MKFTYLLGDPGVGKSTAMRWIRFHLGVQARQVDKPFAHQLWMKDGVVEAVEFGAIRPPFPGTDTLSMSVIEKAIPYTEALAMKRVPIWAEGDRLANNRFFEAVRAAGYTLQLFYLTAPAEIVADRRETRAKTHGLKIQDGVWVQSRSTKARALAEAWHATVIPTYHPADIIAGDIIKEAM